MVEARRSFTNGCKARVLTPRKVMLSFWWDWKGIVHHELLEPGQTINSTLYCQQLMRLKQAIKRKRSELINKKGIVFRHDNARAHISLVTRQKLRELGWEVLMHPPYSPDLASSDYHLFRSRCKVGLKGGLWKSLGSVFRPEISEVLQWRNYDFTRKVAKDHRSKRYIYHWLVLEIYMNIAP